MDNLFKSTKDGYVEFYIGNFRITAECYGRSDDVDPNWRYEIYRSGDVNSILSGAVKLPNLVDTVKSDISNWMNCLNAEVAEALKSVPDGIDLTTYPDSDI